MIGNHPAAQRHAGHLAAGRTAAKARGVKFGRTPAMTPEKLAAAKSLLAEPGKTMTQVAAALGVHRATLYRALGAQQT